MMNSLHARISKIPAPYRTRYSHPELQAREDITVYLVHAHPAQLLAVPWQGSISECACSQLNALVLLHWPQVTQSNRFIAIVNALQRVRNPACGRDDDFLQWLNGPEELKIPA